MDLGLGRGNCLCETCYRCGGEKLHAGVLREAWFYPDDVKFFSMKAAVKLQAQICLDCGAIALAGDPREVAEMIKSPPSL